SSVKLDVCITKESDCNRHHYESIECNDISLPWEGEEEMEPKYEEILHFGSALGLINNIKLEEYVTVHPDAREKQIVVYENAQASLKNTTKQQTNDQTYIRLSKRREKYRVPGK
ncbi:hypothetical protein EVAR_99898_1, partial [Eumeta japonica]